MQPSTEQAAALAGQLTGYIPRAQAEALASLLAALRAGRIDPAAAQQRLSRDQALLEAVHRLAARTVTLRIPGSALGILFKKDASLRSATITIGDVERSGRPATLGQG